MLIGYARVSTHDQNPEMQIDALKKAGCKEVFTDKVTGTARNRPELDRVKEKLREADTLVIWRLDRLGRSLKDLIEWANYLEELGVGLKSLHESIDTTNPSGKLVFHIFGALAEFERNLIIERTKSGLEAARVRGRVGGRKKALHADKRKVAVDLYNKKELSIKKICEMMEVSKTTLYRYVRDG